MDFAYNPWLYVMVGCVIALVIGQSLFFLIRAIKHSKEIGMDQVKVKKIIKSTILFSIAPAFAVVISMVALSGSLGLAIPWLRLSVAGSMTYESTAAQNALSAWGITLGSSITAQQFVTVVAVMTTGIIIGLVVMPFICERYQNGMIKLEQKDPKWSDILTNSLFMGMISAFIGFVFCDMTDVITGVSLAGLLPVCVFFIAALTMIVCGVLLKKLKWKWLSEYALPISLIVGMAAAIPLSFVLK